MKIIVVENTLIKDFFSPRHRVFVSCDERDEKFKQRIAKLEYVPKYSEIKKPVFLNCLFTKFEVLDNGEDEAEIIKKVREIDLENASLLILLCGINTKNNVQIDWQLRAAMDQKRPLAILVINLPSIAKKQAIRAGERKEIRLIGKNNLFDFKSPTREIFKATFPYLPARIIDNLHAEVTDHNIFSISIIDWDTMKKEPINLKEIVSISYMRAHQPGTYYNVERPILREEN